MGNHEYFEGVDWDAVANRVSERIEFEPIDLETTSLSDPPKFKCDIPLPLNDRLDIIRRKFKEKKNKREKERLHPV